MNTKQELMSMKRVGFKLNLTHSISLRNKELFWETAMKNNWFLTPLEKNELLCVLAKLLPEL